MNSSLISPTGTPTTSLASNASIILNCGNMGVIQETIPTQTDEYAKFVQFAWACGAGYESALATLTKTSAIVFPLSTSALDTNLLDCGYSTTINATNNAPLDCWNCGRSYARDYALSDAFSLRPTNLIQYFVFALLVLCILL
ncbi:hypothetical protein N7582_005181 [Saccharomyces uvarum]|uniref:Uncharacterized protein n=1 Tax=Saccharomyces uvarum TaxID=230603 RepID=A0AA35J9F0_SACUV|nr:hypothetical protein N7582_005181 [Saccharomyces uvarum]CAI4051362.1 hypothetical protein SUVC_15G1380 [Saccharomyces uvarum]